MKIIHFTLGLFALCLFNTGFAQDQKDQVTIDSARYRKVEIPASVDVNEWKAHLIKELTPLVDKASRKLSPGTYVVNVRFLVELDGHISDCVALNDPGYNIGRKVAAIVKKGPHWKPGMQNGRPVRSYHTQPITIVISP